MARRARTSTLALGLSALLGLSGLFVAGAGPAAAEAGADTSLVASEVTLPAPPHVKPAAAQVDSAGTGVQWWSEEKGPQWWNPAAGTSVADPGCPPAHTPFPNGDTSACLGHDTYEIRDLVTGSVRVRNRPEGHHWTHAHTANQVLTWVPGADGTEASLHLLGVGEGAPADAEVELPVGMPQAPTVLAQDGESAFLKYWDGERYGYGLVDFAPAVFRPTPPDPVRPSYPLYSLTPDWLAHYDEYRGEPVRLVSRADGKTTRQVSLPWDEEPKGVQTLGDWLVVALDDDGGSKRRPLRAVHMTSGEAVTVLPSAWASLVAGADGSLYAVGGTDSSHWGLQRITLDPTGVLRAEQIERISPNPAKRSNLRLSQGELAYIEDDGATRTAQARQISLTEPLSAEPESSWSCPVPDGSGYCEPGYTMGDGRLVLLDTEDAGTCVDCVTVVRVREARTGKDAKVWRLSAPAVRPHSIRTGSGHHLHALTRDGKNIVFDIDTGKVVWVESDPEVLTSALWGGTLWRMKDTGLIGVDLATGAVSESVDTGTTCKVERFRVAGEWAMVNCMYGGQGSVVVNLVTKQRIPVGGLISPLAEENSLGQGFVVARLDTETSGVGKLRVIDVRSGAPVVETLTTELTKLSAFSSYVDPLTDSLAYVDTKQTLHVVTLRGIADRPLAVMDRFTEPVWNSEAGTLWEGAWWLSKPAASWRVALADKATGAVVREFTGGEVAGRFTAGWDGKDAAGVRVPNGAYTWTATAQPLNGGPAVRVNGEFTVKGASGGYRPVPPTRVMDTRSGLGVSKAKVGPGATVTLQVAGSGGVPATGVSAVVLNVTAVGASNPTFVSAHPAGEARTSASNLNVVPGRAVSNLVVVPVSGGRVSFYNRAGTVDLLADVAGYYTDNAQGARFKPLVPVRAMDTRSGVGVRKGKVGPAGTVTLQVTGRNGVPSSEVSAVVMNVTATNVTAPTFVSVYPDDTARTSASNLNLVANETRPNLVVVPVVNGKVRFYNHNGSVDLLADVSGYYTTSGTGALFQAVTPARVMDSRIELGLYNPLQGPRQADLGIAGEVGVPAAGVSAVVMNVTVTNVSSPTFVSVFPAGTARTSASTLNAGAGQTVPNLTMVPLGVHGAVTLYNHNGMVHLVGDVSGYFVG
ncbi:FlgD immunoglobulin-like domain containing protein [Streptomyces sp. NPDC093600]|uniref:FlgD immunoglobulin-like domain containing protein n=1 Tax=Streptomyces sp. NPDC093600 TaxID=3366047 RepID=UPI00383062C2